MKPSRCAVLLLLLLLPAAAFAQHKTKKPKVPAIFGQARYVYVEAVEGQEFDPRLYPEDRQAIADVRDALSDWNRYSLTMRREDAELVIVVRKGRVAEAKGGVVLNPGPGPQSFPPSRQPQGQTGSGVGVGAGGEVGTPDDLFEVCVRDPDGTLSPPLWMRTLLGGLDRPRLPLFVEFKDAVDRAYPVQPANQPASQPANQPAKP